MADISLILPVQPTLHVPTTAEIAALRDALENAGHRVELVVIDDQPGLSVAAIEGLRLALGEVLLVLDTRAGYAPKDLVAVAAPLVDEKADLAIATNDEGRGPGPALARIMSGTTAPRSGLVGLTRAALDLVRDDFRPAGDTFAFELLARVKGRWVEVPVGATMGLAAWRPGLDDFRQWKRLADHRFGNASRLIQFCAVGGSGMIVDLSCYFVLQMILNRTALASWTVPPTKVTGALAASRALAIAVAVVWNFSLNRRLTFSYARSGSRGRQFATYVLSNSLGIALSLALSLGLPRKVAFFHAHKMAAAVVGIVAATGVSFSMSRWLVFRRRDDPPASGRDEPREVGRQGDLDRSRPQRLAESAVAVAVEPGR